MRSRILIFAALCSTPVAFAQQAATVQLECHELSSTGNVLGPDETLMNGMACHTVKQAPAAKQNQAPQLVTASERTPVRSIDAPAPVAATNPQPTATPASSDQSSTGNSVFTEGSRVVIAPMGGFETYFAAAVREKKVPIRLTLDKDSAQFFLVSTETEWHGFVYGSGGSANWGPGGGSAAHGSAASSTRGLEASIMLIDAKTKDVIWAYEVHKNSHGALLLGTHATRGQQSLAEACAKHLKEFIEKGK